MFQAGPLVPDSDTPLPAIKPGGREIELKFEVSAPVLKAVQKWPALGAPAPRSRAQKLVSVYFDTEDGRLRDRHVTLRVRTHRRAFIMTVKWDDAAHRGPARGELEVELSTPDPDPALLGPEIAAMIAERAGGRPLVPVYSTEISRTVRHLTTGGSDIEIAFDTGFAIAGEARLEIREIELELKSGAPDPLFALGHALAQAFPVRLGVLPKSERAAQLRAGTPPAAVHASHPLAGDPIVDEAIFLLIGNCIGQFTANWPAYDHGNTVEAVHQMRVAMRRLRSVLWLFNRSFPCSEFSAFQQDAKRLAGALGAARDWDVFLSLLCQGPVSAFPEDAGLPRLVAEAQRRRDEEYANITALLADAATTRFVLDIHAFIARRGWRNAASVEALAQLSSPAREFAALHLSRLHARLLKRGRHLEQLGAEDRHELRKKLKRQRYIVDLFGDLFERRGQVRDYRQAAGRLQDLLGHLNDFAAAHDLVRALPAPDPELARGIGIVLGWCGHAMRADEDGLAKAWKRFREARSFEKEV